MPKKPLIYTPFILLLSMLGATPSSYGQQRLEMQGTTIFGNQESPNVLYVVPWRSAKRPTSIIPPETGQSEPWAFPLDRDLFRRQIQWHRTYGESR
jgi:hypothetical protein